MIDAHYDVFFKTISYPNKFSKLWNFGLLLVDLCRNLQQNCPKVTWDQNQIQITDCVKFFFYFFFFFYHQTMFSYLYIGMSVVLFIKDSTGDKLLCHSEKFWKCETRPSFLFRYQRYVTVRRHFLFLVIAEKRIINRVQYSHYCLTCSSHHNTRWSYHWFISNLAWCLWKNAIIIS